MKTLGIIANTKKPQAQQILSLLCTEAATRNFELIGCDQAISEMAGIPCMTIEELARKADAMIALGGDGTMLHAVRIIGEKGIPLLGVNLGSLGFMTSVPQERLQEALAALQSGKYTLSDRALIDCKVKRGSETITSCRALNDIAMGWGETSRVVTLNISIDHDEVTTFVCDGLIISTPTGSTGHSLSAGGPILHPELQSFVLCPICPHTLSNRPLVFSNESTLEIEVQNTSKQLLLAADGQGHIPLQTGDRIRLTKSLHPARFVQLPDYSYFALLRQKLHWRGANV